MEWYARVLIAVILSVALNLLIHYSPRRRHEQPEGDCLELKYPLGIAVPAVLCIAIAGLAVVSIATGGDPGSAGLVATAFTAIGAYLAIELRVRIVVHSGGFHLYSPWRSDAIVSWPEIGVIRYSAVNRWFILGTGTSRFRISTLLVGFSFFLESLTQHVDQAVWEKAVEGYRRTG